MTHPQSFSCRKLRTSLVVCDMALSCIHQWCLCPARMDISGQKCPFEQGEDVIGGCRTRPHRTQPMTSSTFCAKSFKDASSVDGQRLAGRYIRLISTHLITSSGPLQWYTYAARSLQLLTSSKRSWKTSLPLSKKIWSERQWAISGSVVKRARRLRAATLNPSSKIFKNCFSRAFRCYFQNFSAYSTFWIRRILFVSIEKNHTVDDIDRKFHKKSNEHGPKLLWLVLFEQIALLW